VVEIGAYDARGLVLSLVEETHLLLRKRMVRKECHEVPVAERLRREERRKLRDEISANRALAQVEIVVDREDGPWDRCGEGFEEAVSIRPAGNPADL
jgi:hypothetical protein